jgi:hypothetical protein
VLEKGLLGPKREEVKVDWREVHNEEVSCIVNFAEYY